MHPVVAKVICLFCICPADENQCVCTRCGRETHAWEEPPQLIDSAFELHGVCHQRRRAGKGIAIIYAQVERKRYTCSRCGATVVRELRRLVKR